MMDYREQINELEQADTEVKGQSLKDKIEGITFTMNPVCSSSEINIMDNKFALKVSELEDKVDRIQKRDKMINTVNQQLQEKNRILAEKVMILKEQIGVVSQ